MVSPRHLHTLDVRTLTCVPISCSCSDTKLVSASEQKHKIATAWRRTSERRRNSRQGLKGFYLTAKARIWR